jgi:CubicO group peptidase (beta-lactamase class C family)
LTGFDGDTGGPDNNVVSGLVVDGTLYRKNCHTPLGPFPFCDVAVFGVQSVTKSMFASAALLNLAQEYGAAFLDRSVYIDDSGHKYLPEVDGVENEAARNIWKEMTLRHLSNMASGLAETPVDPEAHDMYAEFATSGHDLNAWDLEFEKPDAIGAKIAVAIRTPPMR